MCVLNINMTKKKTHTVLDCVEDIFKPFVNDKGQVEISENINPVFVMFIVAMLGICKTFLLVIINPTCPKCGKKMYRFKVVDFYLNNTVDMKKQTYLCSDKKCGCVVTPSWGRFIEAGCNYTKAVKEYALELGLICNVSYQRMSEIIKWAHGVDISRETLYKFRKEKFAEFSTNLRNTLRELLESSDIKCSNILSYDEQHVKIFGEWMYKLTAMDPVSGHILDFCVASKEEFDQKYVKKFLEPLIKEFEIEIVVTDGHNMYPSILEELGVKHKLCIFHVMQSFCRKIIGKIVSYNKKIKKLEKEIAENQVRIDEIKELRKEKAGKPSKEEQPIVNEKKDLERANRQKRDEIRKLTHELNEYVDVKDYTSDMLKPKTKQSGKNRCTRLVNTVEEKPKEIRGFINKLPDQIDSMLLHTEYDDVPTTNNLLELYHLTTLNRHDKKKYKTVEGLMEEVWLKTYRWEMKVVLGIW